MNTSSTSIREALLALNVGSSTFKAGAFLLSNPEELLFGLSIDMTSGVVHESGTVPLGLSEFTPYPNLQDIVARILRCMEIDGLHIATVVHRVVHGGRKFHTPQWLSDEVTQEIEKLEELCPLHQPPALEVIHHIRALCPAMPQLAVFDTAFHHGQPRLATTYALPAALRNLGLRSYGFHGVSCMHVLREIRRLHPELLNGRIIIAHLGSGASMTAVEKGSSMATSMGFSTLDGLPMGSRIGQLDAGVLLYLLDQGWTKSRLTDLLYHNSGLLGLSDLSGDMRELLTSDTDAAQFAVDFFAYRAAREAASLAGALSGLDTLVFTGGIGENQPQVREKIVTRLRWLGAQLDVQANKSGLHTISTALSKIKILIVPADEQREMAYQAQPLLTEVRQKKEPA